MLEIINENKVRIEPYSELVDSALLQYNSQTLYNIDTFSAQENDEVACTNDDNLNLGHNSVDFNAAPSLQNIFVSDIELSELIRSLNIKQRLVFEYIFHWAKKLCEK